MRKKITFPFISVIILICLSMTMFTGCGGKKKTTLDPSEIGTDKELFDKANSKVKRDPEKARMLYKEIMHLYPDSIYSRRAKIGIADSYYKEGDSSSLIIAANEYEEYVNLYPNSPDSIYSKFQVSQCYFRQMKKPGRDQTNTHLAIKSLESMIQLYPDSKEADIARENLKKARLNLAFHYFGIGKSNYIIRAAKGAINRFKQVMDEYPEFPDKAQLFYYTGMSYFRLGEFENAISFFQKLINTYPQTKYGKKAQKMLPKVAEFQKKFPQKPQPPESKPEEKKEGDNEGQ